MLQWKSVGKVGIGSESNITDIVIDGESNIKDIHTAAFEKLKDIFHQESFLSINNQESKLRTYGKLKTSIGMEKYLDVMVNTEEREAISKIRLSNHDLMIEKGRHQKPVINKELRLCPFCKNAVEDENHFVLNCGTFSSIRNPVLREIEKVSPHYKYLWNQEKLIFLLTDENALKLMGNYLHRAFISRRFLLQNHKNNE